MRNYLVSFCSCCYYKFYWLFYVIWYNNTDIKKIYHFNDQYVLNYWYLAY